MGNGIAGAARSAAYAASSAAKVGWYGAHYLAGRRLYGPLTPPGEAPKPMRSDPPDLAELRRRFTALFEAERRDVAAGVYKLPRDLRRPPNLARLLREGAAYLREAKAVGQRAHTPRGGVEVRERRRDALPGYYQQNFHFQSDGWLSEGSAAVYDTQVETLFTGAADTMRRRTLPLIRAEIDRLIGEGRSEGEIVLADVACGTGSLMAELADNFQATRRVGIDLSAPYLQRAKRAGGEDALYVNAPAERLPFADGSVDVLVTIYLFHELPPRVRREAAAEFARVLRPGGLYVHADSIQYGDTGLDALLETFPRAFHEPYYDGYCKEDLPALFREAGLAEQYAEPWFLTKVGAYRKAPAA